MFPQLNEILTLIELSKLKILAGEEGLANEVKFVTVMDNPDIVYWLEENELLLTNGYFLKDYDDKQMIHFIDELASRNIAALFIKFKRFIMKLPASVLEYADAIGFPIVEVPVEMSWTNISEPINRYLNERQFYFLHQAMSLRDDLLKLILSGGTLNELCNLCGDAVGKELAILDVKMKEVASSKAFNWPLFKENNLSIQKKHRYTLPIDELIKYEHYSITTDEETFFLLPIKYDADVWGYIVLETSIFKPLIYADLAKTEQLAALSVVEISKLQELKKIEGKYYREFISHLINGEIQTLDEIILRGKQLGRTIYDEYIVCVVERKPNNNIDDFLEQLKMMLRKSQLIKECLYLEKKDSYLFLIPVLTESQTSYHLLYKLLSQKNQIGVSTPHSVIEIPKAYKEAKFAYSCKELMKDNQVFFADTGLLQLFFTEKETLNHSFMREYFDTLIKPLMTYDQQNNTELVKTLRVFINKNLSVHQTASELYIHENTLRSRIKRIEIVTNKNLQSMHDVFQLMLGLYIEKFITKEIK
ncbi:purine catabolism regulator [Enterococcus sp. PF1-24]|uniref:PucR family transcriptional regulator n=1 Tax=unclassified Enterococcus TaxID=2608891 RepID=UPI002475F217|nr:MULTISPECIES: PucR family transcriptional regulator [unclassified Enterococcus]MDH6365355.1 purine catabolism regulator [Enterococcus sp. PFB1-1]MDH6402456.1 purine catabolism regulator [Enterococcus sp. PF1-24]